MAWTAPRTWSVGEIVTAAIMNTHVRDDLKYLKGQAGAVAIEDRVAIGTASAPTHQLDVNASGINIVRLGAGAYLEGRTTLANLLEFSSGAYYNGSNWTTNASATDATIISGYQGAIEFFANTGLTANATFTPTSRMKLTASGLGIGTASPAGPLHVVGTVAGTGFLHASASAVTSLQTIAAAGTVTNAALFLVIDRNNTGGGVVVATNIWAAVGGSTNYANNDTITIAVTAGGAITVQRTLGTNGTHNISMLVVLV